MSRKSSREALLQMLVDEIRAGQRATDLVDEAACRLMGINRTDGRCLDILEQRGRMSAGELASEARITSGAVTAVIDRLESAGYARRVSDPADRRRVLVEPTEAAYKLSEELMGRMGELGFPKANAYSDEQLETLLDFMRFSRELQEDHAEWLRLKLAEQGPSAAPRRTRRRLRGHG
jgi:DNA-binding MarR family transcriptional regulator